MHLQEEEMQSLFEAYAVSIQNQDKTKMAAFSYLTFKAAVTKACELSYLKGKLDSIREVRKDITSIVSTIPSF
jgi:hypothetical protein